MESSTTSGGASTQQSPLTPGQSTSIMAATPVPHDFVFSSQVISSRTFDCEVYETIFRIPIKKLPVSSASPPKRPPSFGPWLDSEWVRWVQNHPAFKFCTNESDGAYSHRLSFLREVIWPAFASYIMIKGALQGLFFDLDMLGMLNWYRAILGWPQQGFVETDSRFSDGLWWFMLADSPWAAYQCFDNLLYSTPVSVPDHAATKTPQGIVFAPHRAATLRAGFGDMCFPMNKGLEGSAMNQLCWVMEADSQQQNWAAAHFHWDFARDNYIWIKYWNTYPYRGSLLELLGQREKWLQGLQEVIYLDDS